MPVYTYLLLIKVEYRTVSYGPSFFRGARATNPSGSKEDPYLTVRTEKTKFVRYLLYRWRHFGDQNKLLNLAGRTVKY